MLVETEFSKFIRNASPEEQQRVFNRVIDKAIDDQRRIMGLEPLSKNKA